MPRQRDIFGNLRRQVDRTLDLIRREIADVENHLSGLRQEALKWTAALSGIGRGQPQGVRVRSPARSSRTRKVVRKRNQPSGIDWDKVLAGLPNEFTLAEIQKRIPALSRNPRAAVMAVARWSRGKAITKIGDGRYHRRPRGPHVA